MLTWLLNPWMLIGGLAVASPILIHLLNKRRFKIVEWAAMDFLFQADKKNRRRVQLENLILLLLRCLAMLLIAFMLARPFLPSRITGALQQTQKVERVILIDDSLSQHVLRGTEPAIELAKKSAIELVTHLARDRQTEDWVTVTLTSHPGRRVLDNEPLTPNTLASIVDTIKDIPCSDRVADYSESLGELQRYLSGKRENVGRAVYFFSDMRERDWVALNDADAESAPRQLINHLSEKALGCFVIDVGSPHDDNLSVVTVRPENLQVAGKVIRFQVEVANHGSRTLNDLRVMMQVDEGQPDYEVLASLAPGAVEQVAFRYVFSTPEEALGVLDDASRTAPPFRNYRIVAEIDRQSLGEKGLADDQLLEDSSRLFAARVIDGISVLLVDGDPSAARERSETHYLQSLDVLGTGLDMKVVNPSELETVSLSQYQVIFLCNVDEASPDRIKAIETWVKEGGALVIMPGNRVRASTFNKAFYRQGSGLSPIALDRIAGDPTMAQWKNFEVDAQIHPAFQVVVDSDATSLSNVDVFSWWKSKMNEQQVGKSLLVPLRLNDEDNSPVMVERSWGKGKVIAFTIPADGDWHMWPSSPTFAPVFVDLIDYLVGSRIDQASVGVGGTISYPVDLSVYQSRVVLRDPTNEKIEAIAKPIKHTGPEDSGSDNSTPDASASKDSVPDAPALEEGASEEGNILYEVNFPGIEHRGFYELELTRHTGEKETVLFAVNPDPQESRLKRLPKGTIDKGFFADSVALVSTQELTDQSISGGKTEIWMQLLMGLFVVLIVEQFLGWWWGRKR